ncbi:MAG: DUF58 domain-containing protein [Gammaproteobacteria bacterium]|nr:DUF58 domain-containing protein [Gammaproteobacteria bacterium]
MQLLDPQVLASSRDLVWFSRHSAQSMLLGLQRGQLRGAGIEFQQYRSYQAGDPIRHIDWKLFARSDRYFVREAERETQMHVCIVLDTSASMTQASFTAPKLNKLHYAKCWIATLCWLLNLQGDSFSLLTLCDQNTQYLPEGRGQPHHRRLARTLEQLEARGHWPKKRQLTNIWKYFEQPCQVILVSDFFETESEISDFATHLLAGKRPCLPLQLLIEAEQTFPFDKALKVRNPEVGRSLEVNAKQQRKAYLQAFCSAQQKLTAHFNAHECTLTSIAIEQPLQHALRNFIHTHSGVS